MADIVTPSKRSQMMAGIGPKDTKLEILVRNAMHKAGFRYRLHVKTLPGKPDLVFPKYNSVIFINGCFWHGHDCHLFKWPKTRPEFWRGKIEGNRARDMRNRKELLETGWRVMTIWECALKGREKIPLEQVIGAASKWLGSSGNCTSIPNYRIEGSKSGTRIDGNPKS